MTAGGVCVGIRFCSGGVDEVDKVDVADGAACPGMITPWCGRADSMSAKRHPGQHVLDDQADSSLWSE